MQEAAVDRILQRLCIARGGTSTHKGAFAWDVEIPEDPNQEAGPKLRFVDTVKLGDAGRVEEIGCDAPVDDWSMEQLTVLAGFQTNLAEGVGREAKTFASFAEALAFLKAELGADIDDEIAEISDGDDDDEAVFVSNVDVAREPWISLSIDFQDEVDPEWLLEKNGELTHVHFEAFEGDVTLATAFPLATLTGQRLFELVDDLKNFRKALLAELAAEDSDEEFPG